MAMRWEEERYARLYTRDTLTWLGWSMEAQGLFALILRKVDRAGIIHLGHHGVRGVAAAVGHGSRWRDIEKPLQELLDADTGSLRLVGEGEALALVLPNYMDAQEAKASDAQRQREKRERDRAKALAAPILGPDRNRTDAGEEPEPESRDVSAPSHSVTEPSRPHVTQESHAGDVTPSLAVPCRPEPSRATPVGEPPAPGGQESLFPSPTPKAKASKATPEGLEFRALSEALGQEFQAARREAYPWRTKAGPSNAAVKSLVALRPADTTPESHRAEVVRRWGLALRHDNAFHRVDDMAKFASRYAAYGPEGSATVEAGRGGTTQHHKDVKRGRFNAADSQSSHATASVGAMKDF